MSESLLVDSSVKDPVRFNFKQEARSWQKQAEGNLSTIVASQEQGMGHLEESLERDTQELQRAALEKAVQAKADATPPHCPRCGRPLSRLSAEHERTIESRFGPIRVRRTHGYCKKCRQWFYPADLVLGLNPNASASPSVQEMAALVVSKMPVADASKVIERLTGRQISPATLDREARRQGKKAQNKRQERDELVESIAGYKHLASQGQKQAPPGAFTFVIQIDAWNIRERDEWGKTAKLRKQGIEPQRWHWVYGATCFCLNQRVKKGERALILHRGYVMTRLGIDALARQLRAEALRQGLSQAAKVLVIADGAVWIWNLVEDLYPQAEQRLDFYHAAEHLWAVARELYGQGTSEARAWVEPLLKGLKKGQAVSVIQSLEEVLSNLREEQAEKVRKEKDYLAANQQRMDYAVAKKAGEPLGSGPMESTCRQYQCRFKRPGQFWSQAGDEGLMTLETFWRNDRWHLLFPHAQFGDPAKN